MSELIKILLDQALKISTPILADGLRDIIKKLKKNNNLASKKDLEKIRSKEFSNEISIRKDVAPNLLNSHLAFIKAWSNEISFSDLRGSKKLCDVYIELQTYIMPRSSHFDISEQENKVKLINSVLENNKKNYVILGAPGAGKTTSMKKLCSVLLKEKDKKWNFPLLIRFRSINFKNTETPIRDEISKIIPFELSFDDIKNKEIKELNNNVFVSFLEELKIIIILDGFDEIPTQKYKETTIREIRS